MSDTQILRDILSELKKITRKLDEVKGSVESLESTVAYKD